MNVYSMRRKDSAWPIGRPSNHEHIMTRHDLNWASRHWHNPLGEVSLIKVHSFIDIYIIDIQDGETLEILWSHALTAHAIYQSCKALTLIASLCFEDNN